MEWLVERKKRRGGGGEGRGVNIGRVTRGIEEESTPSWESIIPDARSRPPPPIHAFPSARTQQQQQLIKRRIIE